MGDSAPRYPAILARLEGLVVDVGHAVGWRIWAWAKLYPEPPRPVKRHLSACRLN